jgi:8-oxo-dGTP diphosphatase
MPDAEKAAADAARPKVGVGVMIVKGGKVLIAKRKGSHGSGEYGFLGGHVEHGETIAEAAYREVAEECGVGIKNLRLMCVTDLLKYAPKHYIDIGFTADWESGDPELKEPEKFEDFEWREIDNLPKNMFGPCHFYVESYKTGKLHFTQR